MNFQISGLPLAPFADLFAMDDHALQQRGAKRYLADKRPGFPCRVSLQDAEIGEPVILVPFQHLAVDSPYKASGPVFVRQAASPRHVDVNEVPEQLRTRLLSARAYDESALMVEADVTEGRELEATVRRLLGRTDVAFLHLHFARPGCYAARVDRT